MTLRSSFATQRTREVGIVAAIGASRLITRVLYGVGSLDVVTFTSVPVVIGVVALAAGAIPAWRATRVDPLIAMRSEWTRVSSRICPPSATGSVSSKDECGRLAVAQYSRRQSGGIAGASEHLFATPYHQHLIE